MYGVTYHMYLFWILKYIFSWKKWLTYSVEGLLSTGPTPSSYKTFLKNIFFTVKANASAHEEFLKAAIMQ